MVPAAKKRKQIQSMKHAQDSSDSLFIGSVTVPYLETCIPHKTWRNNWCPVMGSIIYTFLGLRAGYLQHTLAVVARGVSFQKQLRKKVFPGNFGGRRKSCHALWLVAVWFQLAQPSYLKCFLPRSPVSSGVWGVHHISILDPLIIPTYHNSIKKKNKNLHSEMISHQEFCAKKGPKPLLAWFLKGLRRMRLYHLFSCLSLLF